MLLMPPARAVNSRLYPLEQIIRMSLWIGVGPGEIKSGELVVEPSALKGAVTELRMKLAPAAATTLMPRVAKGQPFVLFGGKTGVLFGFTNGTWFQAARTGAAWSVAATRPDLARTYTGTSDALAGLVRDVLAGRAHAPEPNPKAGPLLGPIVTKVPIRKTRHRSYVPSGVPPRAAGGR